MKQLLKKISIALLIFLTTVNANAAVALKSGQPSPYDGILLDSKESNDLKKDLLDKDLYKQLNESYEKSLKFYQDKQTVDQQRIDILSKNNLELYNTVSVAKDTQVWEKTLFFILGVGIAGLGMYVAIKAAPRIN